jgi:hypothetical protein
MVRFLDHTILVYGPVLPACTNADTLAPAAAIAMLLKMTAARSCGLAAK